MPKHPPPAPLYMEPRVLCSCGALLTVRRVVDPDPKDPFGMGVVVCSSRECANLKKEIVVKIPRYEAEVFDG